MRIASHTFVSVIIVLTCVGCGADHYIRSSTLKPDPVKGVALDALRQAAASGPSVGIQVDAAESGDRLHVTKRSEAGGGILEGLINVETAGTASRGNMEVDKYIDTDPKPRELVARALEAGLLNCGINASTKGDGSTTNIVCSVDRFEAVLPVAAEMRAQNGYASSFALDLTLSVMHANQPVYRRKFSILKMQVARDPTGQVIEIEHSYGDLGGRLTREAMEAAFQQLRDELAKDGELLGAIRR
jgi:hypothetical protein